MTNKKKSLKIADISDVDLGQSISVEVEGGNILVSNTEEGFFAVRDLCTHAFTPLCGGYIQGTLISCPLHGAVFDLKTGEAMSPPAYEDLETFEIESFKVMGNSSNELKEILNDFTRDHRKLIRGFKRK